MEKIAKATNARIVTNIQDLTSKDLGKAGLVDEKKIANDEIMQLKTTIVNLRERLEQNRMRFESEIRGVEKNAQDELNQLQETIRTLREKLEKGHATK